MKAAERISILELLRQRGRVQGEESQNISLDGFGSYYLLDEDPHHVGCQGARHRNALFAQKQGAVRMVWCKGDVDAFVQEASFRAYINHAHVVPIWELIVEKEKMAVVERIPQGIPIEEYCSTQSKEKVFALLSELAVVFDGLVSEGIPLGWIPFSSLLVHDGRIVLSEFGLWNRTPIPVTIRWLLSEASRLSIPAHLITWGQLAIKVLQIEGEGVGGSPLVFSLLKGKMQGELSCLDLLRSLQQREMKPIFSVQHPWKAEGEREFIFRMALGTTLLVWSRIRTPEGSFFLLNTPLTQAHLQALGGNNQSHFSGPQRPVERISLHGAMDVCNQISRVLGLAEVYVLSKRGVTVIPDSNGVRLPTHEEWMNAAQAGEPYVFAGAIDPKACAWYEENSNKQTADVQQLQSNGFGLYDMSGNVWEWVYNPQTSQSHGVGGSYRESYSGISLGAKLQAEAGTTRSDLGMRPLIPIFW